MLLQSCDWSAGDDWKEAREWKTRERQKWRGENRGVEIGAPEGRVGLLGRNEYGKPKFPSSDIFVESSSPLSFSWDGNLESAGGLSRELSCITRWFCESSAQTGLEICRPRYYCVSAWMYRWDGHQNVSQRPVSSTCLFQLSSSRFLLLLRESTRPIRGLLS